mmetsp:Transcript_41024/g.76284  ORF Transcript_41024/g.76284 Transcript_41024/m.76284 type:complete len:187 (-) Transcript_41024:60-620(-)
MSAATWLAAVSGLVAALMLIAYYVLLSRLTSQKKKKSKKKSKDGDFKVPSASAEGLQKGGVQQVEGRRHSFQETRTREEMAAHLGRGPEILEKEQLLKRDALHIFRKLQAASVEEKPALYAEAVKLFDGIEQRGFSGMGALTSARIVFCNAVMECDGLEALRGAQDAKDTAAAALVERIVPIIFST